MSISMQRSKILENIITVKQAVKLLSEELSKSNCDWGKALFLYQLANYPFTDIGNIIREQVEAPNADNNPA